MKTTTTLLALLAALTCMTAPVAAEDTTAAADEECPPLWFDVDGNPHFDPDCIQIPPSEGPLFDSSP